MCVCEYYYYYYWKERGGINLFSLITSSLFASALVSPKRARYPLLVCAVFCRTTPAITGSFADLQKLCRLAVYRAKAGRAETFVWCR